MQADTEQVVIAEVQSLAQQINDEHAAVQEAATSALYHARKAGTLLVKAQNTTPYGSWLGWVDQHCDFSRRKAQTYMRIARRWHELEADAQSSAHLSIDGALRLLSDSTDDDDESESAQEGAAREPADEPSESIYTLKLPDGRVFAPPGGPEDWRQAAAWHEQEAADPERLDAVEGENQRRRAAQYRALLDQVEAATAESDEPAVTRTRAPVSPPVGTEPEPAAQAEHDLEAGETVDEADSGDDELTIYRQENERLEKEVAKLTAQLESLQAEDRAEEITALHHDLAALNGRLDQEMRTAHQVQKDATRYRKLLDRLQKIVSVEGDREIVKAVQWQAKRLRELEP